MALRVDTPPWPPYFTDMLSRSAPPSGFIEPCLPSPGEQPPTGPDWVHEIKHNGYRLMARRDPIKIRLLTRNGYDWGGFRTAPATTASSIAMATTQWPRDCSG